MHSLPPLPSGAQDILPLSEATYHEAEESLCRFASTLPGVRTIARFGEISTPGVSDLDLLIACEDDHYETVEAAMRTFPTSIPFGSYLFTHQIFVLPSSFIPLRSLLQFDHCFFHFTVLQGEESLLDTAPVPPMLRAINTMIWNTALYRTLFEEAERHDWSLRRRLLLLHTIVRHCALDARLLDEDSSAIRSWGTAARNTILSSADPTKAIDTMMQEALQHFAALEEKVHRWWEQERGAASAHRTIPFPLPFNGTAPISIPGCYRDIAQLLESSSNTHPSPPPDLKEALRIYHAAISAARSWGASRGDDTILFLHHGRGIFPSPWNLRFSAA